MRLAVIPARGGSKRIPHKNIKSFCGKPMIAWSIEAALKSNCFDKVIVSTDDDEIARIAQEWGAEIPYMRPAELANDYTGTIPVIRHAIEWFIGNGEKPDYVCCIYATAPFVSISDLRKAYDVLKNEDCAYAFSVTSYPSPIQRAFRINESNRVEMFYLEYFNIRSQDLEEAWHDAGQFYWGRTDAWQEDRPIFSKDSVPIIIPRYRVQDIDTQEDWDYAELLFQVLKKGKGNEL